MELGPVSTVVLLSVNKEVKWRTVIMEHSFDVDIATNYGVLEAILLKNFCFWIDKNKANNKHFYNDNYWTYNSTKAFGILFPYYSERQISNALKHLINEGILISGNYNKSTYDRTLWYALTKRGECILQKCKMDTPKKSNGLSENVETITYNNTYDNTNEKQNSINKTLSDKSDVGIKPTKLFTKKSLNITPSPKQSKIAIINNNLKKQIPTYTQNKQLAILLSEWLDMLSEKNISMSSIQFRSNLEELSKIKNVDEQIKIIEAVLLTGNGTLKYVLDNFKRNKTFGQSKKSNSSRLSWTPKKVEGDDIRDPDAKTY